MPFTPRAQVQSVVQTTVNTEVSLASSPSAGATSFTLDTVPDGLAVGAVIAIDAYTTECELRQVTNIAGNVVTFSPALVYAHAAGDAVVPANTPAISATLFGARGDSTTDDWAALQRGLHETDRIELWLTGHKLQYQITQPLFLRGSHLRDIIIRCQANSFAPIDTLGAAVTNCQNATIKFTATASDNTFTTTTTSGANVGNLIAFNNPTGETLPGGIVSGRWYYVLTTPTSTTFTISATRGGSTFDVTSDGTGWAYPDVNTLGRVFLETVYVKGSSGNANLNIVRLDLQQPAYTYNLRIDGAVGGGGVLLWLAGQISNHYNLMLAPTSGSTGILIGQTVDTVSHFSSGHGFFGVNITGSSITGTTTAIWCVDTNAIEFCNLWTEGNFVTHLKLGDTGTGAIQTKVSNWMQSGQGTTLVERNHQYTTLHVTGLARYTPATNIIVDNVLSLTLPNAGPADGRSIIEFTIPGSTKGWPIFPTQQLGSYESPSNNATASANTKIVARYLNPRSGFVTIIKALLGAGASDAKVKAIIYDDSSALPGALLATSDELTITSGAARAWRTLTFSTPLLVRGGVRYWIGWICDQDTLWSYWQDSPTLLGQAVTLADTYSDGPSDPFGTGTAQNVLPALYAVYG